MNNTYNMNINPAFLKTKSIEDFLKSLKEDIRKQKIEETKILRQKKIKKLLEY